MAKKGARILNVLKCTVCGKTNYTSQRNKLNTSKLQLNKYCKQDRKHTIHVSKDKLK